MKQIFVLRRAFLFCRRDILGAAWAHMSYIAVHKLKNFLHISQFFTKHFFQKIGSKTLFVNLNSFWICNCNFFYIKSYFIYLQQLINVQRICSTVDGWRMDFCLDSNFWPWSCIIIEAYSFAYNLYAKELLYYEYFEIFNRWHDIEIFYLLTFSIRWPESVT